MITRALFPLYLLSSAFAFAATVPKASDPSLEVATDIHDSRVGQEVFVFSENAALRAAPADNSKEVAKIAVGKTVKVVARMKAESARAGYEDAWLQVEASDIKAPAFVWGGDLAIAAVDLDSNLRLVAGILGLKEPKDPEAYEKQSELRLVRDSKIVAQVRFEPLDVVLSHKHYAYDVRAEKLGDQGLSPAATLVTLKFTYEADDYPNGQIIFTWNGKDLKQGPEISITNSGDFVVSQSYRLAWPKDPGGKPNCVIATFTQEPSGDEGGSKKITRSFYAWNGVSLAESKKCPASPKGR
jgi:hypothetical protein